MSDEAPPVFPSGPALDECHLLPLHEGMAFYISALTFGTLLGSFITELAAMTLLAILLKRRYFDRGMSARFAFTTLGLLFVNVSTGGTLTHFAAPPVLIVAAKWQWDTAYIFTHFSWRAAASCLVSTAAVAGAVTGGGPEGISPLGLFLGALPPTVVAVVFFWVLG
jgi:hypothetical protein